MARTRRDDGDLTSGLAAWWADQYRDLAHVTVIGLERPSAGRSNETVLATIEWAGGSEQVVVRMPTVVPSFPTYDLRAQSAVQSALIAAGVPAAAPIAVEENPQWLGAPFFVMARVNGRPVGDAPAFDPWLGGESQATQRRVQTGFLSLLARVNRIDCRASSLDRTLRGSTGGMASELGWWIDYINWAADGRPAPGLMDLAQWCADHLPASSPPLSLCWGDARVGNVMFDDSGGVAGALDWELASIGPAEMDIAWCVAMDEMTEIIVNRTVPGFLDRPGTLRYYETQLGRRLEDLAWHEVFALLRATAVVDRQSRNAAAGTEVGQGAKQPAAPSGTDVLLAHSVLLIERFQLEKG
jgi:aminoglycoside phosphotransferase (APT) family kinase protein